MARAWACRAQFEFRALPVTWLVSLTSLIGFCIDFRKVNNVTKPDSYPLPRIEDCVERVGSSSYVI